VSLYVGPGVPRWTPESFEDVEAAAVGGLLDESHWVELKRLIPTTRSANIELGKDIASLANDGGLLIVGIGDDDGRAGAVIGTKLAGLDERIDSIARSQADPPILVRCLALPGPRPGEGCLVVEVPPSPRAPHMVDGRYWARGDKAKFPMSDAQVSESIARRVRSADDAAKALDLAFQKDPMPQDGQGHLFVVLEPLAARPGAMEAVLYGGEPSILVTSLFAAAGTTALQSEIGRATNLSLGTRERILSSLPGGRGPSEHDAQLGIAEVRVTDDGAVSLYMSRATVNLSSEKYGRVVRVVRTVGIIDAVETAVHMARQVGELAAFNGEWAAGVLVTQLPRTIAIDVTQTFDVDEPPMYREAEYRQVTTCSSAEMTDSPNDVVGRLLIPLLRSLGVERRHIERTTRPA
jgi:hypothetical protein